MSGPFGSSQWMYQSARDFYEFPIEQSLKFNDDDTAYLSKSFATTGTDRKKITFSFWYKKTTVGTINQIYNNFNGTNEYAQIAITSDDKLEVYSRTAGGTSYNRTTSAQLRDPSAWYHIVVSIDTTQATADDRIKIYINGVLQTSFAVNNIPPQNTEMSYFISGRTIAIGRRADGGDSSHNLDGYLAEYHVIDGTAYAASDFGEFKSGVWIPKDPSGLTYGTNGFRLSFQNDTVSEGFNTVTYTGNGVDGHSINGLGFSPDVVWVKSRSLATSGNHSIHDTVRGVSNVLFPNLTNAESTGTRLNSFDSDGFTLNSATQGNGANETFVAWCWDAGSGSPVSNTDGSITSTVKANAAYGFSIISYTGTGSTATVGHGLSSAPEMIIIKNRTAPSGYNWNVYHASIGNTQRLLLDSDTAAISGVWNNTSPTSSVFTIGGSAVYDSGDYIAYAFHSVAGYSKVGSYSGSGSAGNAITTGFKPAFVMVKRTDSTGNWVMFDATRSTQNTRSNALSADLSDREYTSADGVIGMDFTDTGFTLQDNHYTRNASGGTYAYIAFADTRDNAFWRDQSGNGNDWQPNNLTYQDSLPDSTTNNFATWNPLAKPLGTPTFSEGNLKKSGSNTLAFSSYNFPSSGKWYLEALVSIDSLTSFGICNTQPSRQYYIEYLNSGNKSVDGTQTAYGSSFTTGDIISCLVDCDAETIEFKKNNVSQGSLSFSLSSNLSSSDITIQSYTGGANDIITLNFGQDSSFAGNKPAQGNTDDNGYGDFYYAPPSGYLALCTANLPDPVIDPAQDDVPSDYFNTVLSTGDGTNATISGFGFQPDFLWHKSRSTANNNQLMDLIRVDGSGNPTNLVSNLTNADGTSGVITFTSDGYTHLNGASNNFYGSGVTYVDWAWKAGNGTSSNTDGSITSTVSVNQKAGFSVVSWTGNGSNTAQSIGHGLGAVPKFIAIKSRDTAFNWAVLHGATTNGIYNLNTTGAINTGWTGFTSGSFDPSNVSSTTFSTYPGLSNSDYPNKSGDDYIAYCFAEIPSYSSFGKYTGNGSADGPFVFTGHAPAFVMVKGSSLTSQWNILDTARDTYNVADKRLFANLSNAEATGINAFDMLSNGFKIRNSDAGFNQSGATYIYMSFASNPFKFSTAR